MRKKITGTILGGLAALTIAAVLMGMSANADVSAHGGQHGRPDFNAFCAEGGNPMYWNAGHDDNGVLPDPAGWQVERFRHNQLTYTVTFMGDDARDLQTYSNDWWDWTDTQAATGALTYTYQVTALDENQDEIPGRQSAKVDAWCEAEHPGY